VQDEKPMWELSFYLAAVDGRYGHLTRVRHDTASTRRSWV